MYIGTNGLGEIDWNGILKDIVGGVSAYKAADAQADLMKMQLQAQQAQAEAARQASLMYAANPSYSPYYGAPSQSSNLMPLLLLGGAALLVFFLMKD